MSNRRVFFHPAFFGIFLSPELFGGVAWFSYLLLDQVENLSPRSHHLLFCVWTVQLCENWDVWYHLAIESSIQWGFSCASLGAYLVTTTGGTGGSSP
jgi:hypothetical protein